VKGRLGAVAGGEVGVATVLEFEGNKSIMSIFLTKPIVAGWSKCSQFFYGARKLIAVLASATVLFRTRLI
jgi:hypothetical protein